MRVTHIAADELLARVGPVLPRPPATLLEVGCGRGELAAALLSVGYRVTALDRSPEAVAAARAAGVEAVEGDFLEHEGGPYEAVLFSRSLHEIGDLDGALRRSELVLCANGLLIVDEFARERPDERTAAFFYDMCLLLGAAGVLSPPDAADENENALNRWRREYGGRRATGVEMIAAVRQRLDVESVDECAYLYRHIGQWLEVTERGANVARRILEVERRRLEHNELVPCGVRIIARKRAAGACHGQEEQGDAIFGLAPLAGLRPTGRRSARR